MRVGIVVGLEMEGRRITTNSQPCWHPVVAKMATPNLFGKDSGAEFVWARR